MRFEVPQFIEVEDKIIGPLTFKQFIYVAGAVGVGVVLYLTIPFFLAVIIGAPIVILGLALAFYKVNDRPFILVMESAFYYFLSNKLYLWKKGERQHQTERAGASQSNDVSQQLVPKLSQNKLKDLSWSLDIKESIYEEQEQVR